MKLHIYILKFSWRWLRGEHIDVPNDHVASIFRVEVCGFRLYTEVTRRDWSWDGRREGKGMETVRSNGKTLTRRLPLSVHTVSQPRTAQHCVFILLTRQCRTRRCLLCIYVKTTRFHGNRFGPAQNWMYEGCGQAPVMCNWHYDGPQITHWKPEQPSLLAIYDAHTQRVAITWSERDTRTRREVNSQLLVGSWCGRTRSEHAGTEHATHCSQPSACPVNVIVFWCSCF